MPTPTGNLDLLAKDAAASQSGVVNWSTDADFLAQVIRSLASERAEDGALRQAATFLAGHVTKLESSLSEAERLDPRVGQEIMRSRRLADVLKSRDDLLQNFMNVLRLDPEVRSQLTARTEELAAEAAQARSETLVRDRTAALEVDLKERRASGEADIAATLRELEAAELASMTARLKSAEEAALAGISAKKTEVETEVELLAERSAQIKAQNAAESGRLAEMQQQLRTLDAEVASRKDEIDRTVRIASLLQNRGNTLAERARVPRVRPSDHAQPIALGELGAWIDASNLLSAAGKRLCLRALTDLLCGSLPVLNGSEVDDFVALLATAAAGGRHVSFDCDPTVITFDDLWVRPASGAPTVLGEALAGCEKEGTVQLCVLRNINRSAAHLWVETLADTLRSGVIPGSMLICLTFAEPPGEALLDALKRLPSIDTTGTMEKAGVIAALARSKADRIEQRIDTSTIEPAVGPAAAEAAGQLLVKDVQIGFADVEWFRRLVTVASALLKSDAQEFILAAARRRAVAEKGGTPNSGKPGLRVIESGGASNA